IAKVANGIADDMLTTTFLAAKCKKLIAPAMNTAMYENPVTQENLEKCRRFGMEIIEPESGRLACGDTGKGKLASVEDLFDAVERACFTDDCLKGYHVLVTAGPTIEAMDPVRFLSNHSSGKMGFAIAKMAQRCGADVTLVAGPNHLKVPYGVTYVPVTSARSMMDAICAVSETQDIIIKAAAVADYRPKTVAKEKMKKGDGELVLELERNPDILAHLGAHKPAKQVLCGFAMETENVLFNARKKLNKKNLDMIVVNDLREEGAGFAVDSNRVTIIEQDKETALPLMSKEDVAYELCKIVAEKRKEKDA
ncbi:MAG: bifunctional phosphopantothenoylcysteine decarboxylase/phosphopantothenate--cysteine ligase CoaBC, partial [Erysipelotrichaceae bacterium]|nr:bifunctional phosphopantothenoylcysteine decarboxylase/phosphopantothenate--cysteine ligase CoaBC [Erysipelotrichaceae bacterium]